MAEYKGNDLAVTFNAVSISATATKVEVSEEAAEPKEIDITHAGDTSLQSLEGLPGQPKVKVTISGWDDAGGTSNIWDYAIGDQYTLVVYPEGNSAGKPKRTITNATLIRRSQPIEVEAAVKWDAEFSAIGAVAAGTV